MALYPTFQTPTIIEANAEPTATYKQSVYFDMRKGDIVMDSAGKIRVADGCEAWLQWCVKMISTELGACMAYPNQGVEMEYAMSRDDWDARQFAIEETIKTALMNDPSHRTLEVSEFEFERGADSVKVRFRIIGADGYTGTLSAEIGGE